jgi:hypothetical protein
MMMTLQSYHCSTKILYWNWPAFNYTSKFKYSCDHHVHIRCTACTITEEMHKPAIVRFVSYDAEVGGPINYQAIKLRNNHGCEA